MSEKPRPGDPVREPDDIHPETEPASEDPRTWNDVRLACYAMAFPGVPIEITREMLRRACQRVEDPLIPRSQAEADKQAAVAAERLDSWHAIWQSLEEARNEHPDSLLAIDYAERAVRERIYARSETTEEGKTCCTARSRS